MDIAQALQECCTNLYSSKITERKKSADNLDVLLDNTKAIELLNEDNALVGWNDVLRSVHLHLIKLCENLERNLQTRYKAEVFQVVIEVCKYNAPDCWLSCSKLGEEVFIKLYDVYERRVADDYIKELLFEFCLLQMKLHHPRGATSSSTESYAYNWNNWRKQLRLIYRIIEDELSYHTKSTMKSYYPYQLSGTFILLAVAVCKQESEKLQENELKKVNRKKTSADLLVCVVQKANNKVLRLNAGNLVQYVLQCFDSTVLKKFYYNAYILILKDHILAQPQYLGSITEDDWITLLTVLQKSALEEKFEDAKVTECIKLIFKNGARYCLPLLHFRNQFDFVRKLCENLERNLQTRYKAEVFQIVIEFCKYNAPDCWLSCCKLGEEVFIKLYDVYERRVADDYIKELLFEFCLLQMKLHHPHGATSNSTESYAYNWNNWRKQLRLIYRIIEDELSYHTKSTTKSYYPYQPSGTFILLAVAVCKQIFSNDTDIAISNLSIFDASNLDTSQPSKRLKVDIGLRDFLTCIKQSKSYPCIYVMTELLKAHPEVLDFDQSIELLEILVNIYKEVKDRQRYVYDCLTSVLEIQNKSHNKIPHVDEIWNFITDEILRSLALHQNAHSIHTLLQSLIISGKVKDPSAIYQTFISGALMLENYTVKTLSVTVRYFGLPDVFNGEPFKKKIIKWMTYSNENKAVFSGDQILFAQTLLSLCLKQWPELVNESDDQSKRNFEDVYILNTFQRFLLPKEQTLKLERSSSVSFHKDIYLEVVNAMKELLVHFILVKYDLIFLQRSLSAVTLAGYLLVEINALGVDYDFDALIENLHIEEVFQSINEILYYYASDSTHIKSKLFGDTLKSFNDLFMKRFYQIVSRKYRTYIKTELLSCFFELLIAHVNSRQLQDDNYEEVDKDMSNEVKHLLVNILCNFSMYDGNKNLTENENKVVTGLVQCSNEEYEMLLTVLNSIKNCQLGALGDEILFSVVESLGKIWTQHSTEYKTVLTVLQTCHSLVSHIGSCTSDQLNQEYYSLLTNIYNVHHKYGYKVSIALLDIFQLIFEGNFYINYKRYAKSCLSEYICKFLKSNYQLVRLRATECLVTIFKKSLSDASAYTLQKYIYSTINSMSREVFTIEAQLNSERSTDETVSRTCSVLQTYCTLIICSSLWRKRMLYSLLALTQDKRLNVDLLKKALSMVIPQLQYTSTETFISEHLYFLLSQWYMNQRPIPSFPYEIIECNSQSEFYRKYIQVIIPLQFNRSIDELCTEVNMSPRELIDTCFVELVTTCFFKIATTLPSNKEFDAANMLYTKITDELTESYVQELLITKIDNILIAIMTSTLDENLYEQQFGMEYVLESSEYPRNCLDEILNVIKTKVNLKIDVLEYCINTYLNKIQSIMLQLGEAIYAACSTQDKLKCLHQYFNFIDIIRCYIIKPDCKMADYCLRTIIHTLLLCSEMECDAKAFNVASCNYLQSFITTIISECHEKLVKFFSFIVNKLALFISNENLSAHSIGILRLLIVENVDYFRNIIPDLDPLPPLNDLAEINCIYKELRFKKWGITLVAEIKHFLEASDLSNLCRLEALKHLKQKLAEKKSELRELFVITSKVRDFSEERRKNIIHQLICMLVRLISSNNKKVSTEAGCCLGQIGASNLTTLILQSEDMDVDQNSSPIQLLTTYIIRELYQYIVDQDINIVKNASLILYEVLSTKEGQHFIKNSNNVVVLTYLQPFLLNHKKLRSTLGDMGKKDENDNEVNVEGIWWYSDNNHEAWITHLNCAFLQYFPKKCYLQTLIPLCKINVSFCEKLLPYLVHLYASITDNNVRILSHWIDYYFDKLAHSLTQNVNSSNRILSTQCILDAILFSRMNVKNLQHTYELELNYLKLAQGAFYCSRFFDAIFYIELWCQSKAESIALTKKFVGSPLSLLDLVCEAESSSVCLTAQNILRQSYNAIGEVDGLNGCGHAFLLDVSTRIDHYKQLGRWDQVVLHYDTLLSQGKLNIKQDLGESLKSCGYYGLAMGYFEANAPDYDTFWRLGKYDCDTRQNTNNPYEKHKYIALKSLFEQDKDIFLNAISGARLAVLDSCNGINLQTTKALYGILTDLQMLQELEDVHNMEFADLILKWKKQDSISRIDFKYFEQIKAQRIAVLAGFVKNPECMNVEIDRCKEHLADLYLDLAELARQEKHFNIAKRAITSLSKITGLKEGYLYKKVLEEAQICWAMKDKVTARYLIHELFTKNDNIKLNFASLKLYGQWMAETRSENPQTIMRTYFLEPLDLIKGIQKEKADYDNIFGTYYDIARFSDLEYQRIRSYVKSAEFEQKVHNKEKSREAAEKIRSQGGSSLDNDQKRAVTIYHKQSMIDEGEIDDTLRSKGIYLLLAIKYYMLNLQYSDANNTRIFRVLSLWLENKNSDDLKKLLDDYVQKIPSYKFVLILPQLVPHLSKNSKEDFANHIYSIIERCGKEHPHHTLPILLSLANSNMDEVYVKIIAATDSNEVRVEGAQKLLKKLKSDPSLRNIIAEMELVSKALLELAYLDIDKCKGVRGKNNSFVIPDNTKIVKIRNLLESYLPVITVDIRKDCQYRDVISIHSFKNEFMTVGGINRPKSVLCQCSDGTTKRLLVKGKDDLRQDAVMEQVFTIMNDLFCSNKQTSKLLIRTYKVVPLSKRSGIIEWVENTQLIGECLARLHQKYRPNDWTAARCCSKMKAAGGKSSQEKEKIFKEVCANFSPIMHKFFEEQYPHPTIWYERRRAYTQSLATTSISGYILGLGDRHGGNILLDKNTAEVIHIDFGIAFEQGKVLPTPETVPFRLTRDLEDGMGVTGVNGLFKRSCEKTMEVLRENWETITSILEVLLYDPLYAWTITPAEAYSRQNYEDNSPKGSINVDSNDRENLNVTAERALLRLHQKLHGTELGGSSSVEGQVETLIQQARDPSNLSRLFYGWQAFL